MTAWRLLSDSGGPSEDQRVGENKPAHTLQYASAASELFYTITTPNISMHIYQIITSISNCIINYFNGGYFKSEV